MHKDAATPLYDSHLCVLVKFNRVQHLFNMVAVAATEMDREKPDVSSNSHALPALSQASAVSVPGSRCPRVR